MSGGSYNYLCYADASDIGSKLSDLDQMAARLEQIDPGGCAAADTREVQALIGALDRAIGRLSDVWRAVEWRDSCDWGDDQMLAEIGEYERRHRR